MCEANVKETLQSSRPDAKVEGIHWAGGLHSRTDFNKKKDPIVNWTEVLFRN